MNINCAVFDSTITNRNTTMDTKALRQKILDLAIRGKLVPQDPNDEPASVLLERIKAEKERLIKEGKIKRSKKAAKTSDTPHYGNVPFEVPDSWVWTTLGNIGVWQAGGTPSRTNKAYYEGNIPWLKTGDLNDGLITNIPERISEEAVANSSAKINPAGSILIAMYGATIGKLGILTFPATTNQACCACIEHYAVTQLYLFYFLLSQRMQFIAKGGGGAQPNISKEIIVNTIIPLPPFAEQQRIVAEIERLFAVIDQIEQGKADLQTAIKQAKSKILDLAIHGKLVPQDPNDEPAIELLKRINHDFTPCDNGHYPQLPKGWTICKLEQVANILDNLRKPINSNERNSRIKDKQIDRLYPYYGATGQVGLIDDYVVDGHYLLLGEDGAPFLDKNAIKAYSISGKSWVNNHAHILSPKIDFEFLQYSLNQIDYSEYVNGSTRLKLTQTDMRSIKLMLPPLVEQKLIKDKIRTLFSQLDMIMESL